MQINQHFLEEFAARRDIGNEVLRVFLYLNARLDFENIIQVQQTEIAERLGMQPPNVHRAIKKLEELGVILRGPKVGRSSSWRLNPNAGWKGKVTNLRQAQRQHLELVKPDLKVEPPINSRPETAATAPVSAPLPAPLPAPASLLPRRV